MATTIDISSEYTDDIYEGTEVEIGEANYALLTISWSDIGIGDIPEENDSGSPIIKNAIPEVVVEQSDDEYTSWYPIYQQKYNYEEPVKFRLFDVIGEHAINIYPLIEGAFIRLKIYFNGAKTGEIIYDFHVGS